MKTYQIAVILAILVVGIIAVPVAATSGGQLANANVNGGKDNTAIAVNSNGDGALNVFQNQYNQIDVPSQSVSVTNDITFPTYVQDDMLDIGWLEENMSDISPRRDTARVFDIDDNTLQTAGMMFTFSYRSSDPVLVYGISSTDDDLAMSNSGSPVLDNVPTGHYSHGQLVVYLGDDNKHNSLGAEDLSDKNSVTFTVPSDGYYSFVVDDRATDTLDGTGANIMPDTYDLAYTITYNGIDSDFHLPTTPVVIGTVSQCPVASDGLVAC